MLFGCDIIFKIVAFKLKVVFKGCNFLEVIGNNLIPISFLEIIWYRACQTSHPNENECKAKGDHKPGKHGKPGKFREFKKLSKSQGKLREI